MPNKRGRENNLLYSFLPPGIILDQVAAPDADEVEKLNIPEPHQKVFYPQASQNMR